jgi:hypothetical protein
VIHELLCHTRSVRQRPETVRVSKPSPASSLCLIALLLTLAWR